MGKGGKVGWMGAKGKGKAKEKKAAAAKREAGELAAMAAEKSPKEVSATAEESPTKAPKLLKTPEPKLTKARTSIDRQSLDMTPDYSLHIQPLMAADADDRRMGQLDLGSSAARHHYSELSIASVESMEDMQEKGASEGELRALVFQYYRDQLRARAAIYNADRKNLNYRIRRFVRKHDDGKLNIEIGEFKAELGVLERELAEVNAKLLTVFRHEKDIAEDLTNGGYWDRVATLNWSFIDQLVGKFAGAPTGVTAGLKKKRTEEAQNRFKARLLAAYDATNHADKPKSWCCVEGDWVFNTQMRAAHSVSYNTGEVTAVGLFGQTTEREGHLMSTKNGLMIKTEYEGMLDRAEIAFAPIKGQDDEYKVIFLFENRNKNLAKLEGRRLSFRTSFRPARRYMYHCFIMALLRPQRHEVPGWWRQHIDYGMQPIWATPGPYLKRSTLLTLATQVGHMLPEEVAEFTGDDGLGPTTPEKEEEGEEEVAPEDEMLSSAVQLAYGRGSCHLYGYDGVGDDGFDVRMGGGKDGMGEYDDEEDPFVERVSNLTRRFRALSIGEK